MSSENRNPDTDDDERPAAAAATDASEKAEGRDDDAPEGADQVGNEDAPEMD